MADTTLQTALRTLNRGISTTTNKSQVLNELVELYDSNGEAVDKQPVSRLCEIGATQLASVVFGTSQGAVAAFCTDGKIVGLTQVQYDALATKDSSTLYVIIG